MATSKLPASEYAITALASSDFDEWAALFRAYIDFYESTIPEEQYRRTFDRILAGKDGLQALIVRADGGKGKMVGIAHFFPHISPWGEKRIMLLNDLYVNPDIRGQGLGRRLIEATAEKAREQGCNRVQWTTKHTNTTAQKLYDTMATSEFRQYRMTL